MIDLGSHDAQQAIKSPIDFRFVAVLVAIALAYHILSQDVPIPEEGYDYAELPLTLLYAVSALAAFLIAKRYWGSEVFGKAYLSLGIAFAAVFVAEIIWNYYEVILQIYPFPSIADVFYFGLYPFTLYHLIKNCRYFKRKWEFRTKIFLISFPVVIIAIYSAVSLSELSVEAVITNEDDAAISFFYTLIFVGGAANTTTFAILGIMVFRQSAIASAWALLAGAIFLNDVADFWYYYVEIFGLWERTHPTMSMWLLSNLLVIYSLYKHKKIF
jgi:hypothetical protein